MLRSKGKGAQGREGGVLQGWEEVEWGLSWFGCLEGGLDGLDGRRGAGVVGHWGI